MGGLGHRFDERLMTGQTALNTASVIGSARMSQVRETTFYAKFLTGSTQGAVVVEAAMNEDDTDTWATVGTMTWAAADRTHYVSVTGVHMALRARISTAVDGDGVDVHVVGN